VTELRYVFIYFFLKKAVVKVINKLTRLAEEAVSEAERILFRRVHITQ
jgi:hypothetical protein